MVLTLKDLAELADQFRVNVDDVLMTAMNVLGARSQLRYPRARMLIRLRARPDDPLRLGLPLARDHSPFEVRGDEIRLGGETVADIEMCQDDDALLGYFRKEGKVLTLNSNARSQCTGCIFCPNSLEGASDPRLSALDDLSMCFSLMEAEQGWSDMSHLEEVNLATGCFHEEQPAITHLEFVRQALSQHGFTGQIGFLTSVLKTDQAFERIAETVAPFFLLLTFECFTNRESILKHSKAALRPEEIGPILARAKSYGLDSSFTYIVGLEPMDVALDGLAKLRDNVTRFPNFQIYQAHNRFMERFAAPGADTVAFYLDARKQLERLFADTGLRPDTWSNYRPLWYWSFADEVLSGERI
jgi:hypothetical protein